MTFFTRLFLYWKGRSQRTQREQSGFTVLELMVSLIIISILGVIAYPMTMNQIGKARVAEARNGLGAINRAQQVYLVEHSEFAQSLQDLYVEFTLGSYDDGTFITKYYIYSVDKTPTSNEVHHQALPIEGGNYNTRQVASAVFHLPQYYASVICEATQADGIPNIIDQDTCNDGHFVR
ncbi:MAG: type IV pilin protein [Microcystaceae cyanobacterium]